MVGQSPHSSTPTNPFSAPSGQISKGLARHSAEEIFAPCLSTSVGTQRHTNQPARTHTGVGPPVGMHNMSGPETNCSGERDLAAVTTRYSISCHHIHWGGPHRFSQLLTTVDFSLEGRHGSFSGKMSMQVKYVCARVLKGNKSRNKLHSGQSQQQRSAEF